MYCKIEKTEVILLLKFKILLYCFDTWIVIDDVCSSGEIIRILKKIRVSLINLSF